MTSKSWSSLIKNIQTHWKTSIAISGGLLTLISVYKWATSGPDIDFQANHTVRGYIIDDSVIYANYTVDVSLVNNGDKPFFPQYYNLRVKFEDVELTFKSRSISDSNELINLGPLKMNLEKQKDLTRVNKIEPEGIATGFIVFSLKLTPELRRLDFAHYNYLTFEVYDSKLKKWESEKKYFSDYEQRDSYYPHSGIETIKP